MLDATAKRVLKLLSAGQSLPTRCAAALLLGELGNRDAQIARALVEAVDDPAPELRQQVMEAVGKLRIESALPRLLPRINAGGPESETAAQAASRLGARGMKAVRQVMAQAAPGLRRRLAGALAASGSAGAETAALDALLDKDPGVVDAAARSLLAEVPTLSEASRRTLTEHVLELLEPPKSQPLAPASETALLRVLAGLGDPRGEEAFWKRIEAPHSPELRATALQALGKLPPPASKDRLKRLLACAAAPDFRVAAAALMILRALPVSDRTAKDWLPLFDAPHPAVRRFVIEKIGERDTPELAAALIEQLRNPDRDLRDAALAALKDRTHGREALANVLLQAESPDETWSLARAQAPFARDYTPGLREKILKQALACLEAGDRRADALLFVLREVDPAGLRDKLEERALALRKKKDYPAALTYLRHLGRDPACAESLRYEAAACGLRLSEKDLAGEVRAADPCLQQFARLLHSHETSPLEWLQKARWLEPEDLFYLGFHFAEANDRREHEFGGEVLRLLLQRSPRSKLAKDARSKLRSLGLD